MSGTTAITVLIPERSLLLNLPHLGCRISYLSGITPLYLSNITPCRSDFDDSMNGTTAITVLIRGRSLLLTLSDLSCLVSFKLCYNALQV